MPPSMRLLRAMRHFDWVESPDLLEAAEAPQTKQPRNTWHKALKQMVHYGYVERRVMDGRNRRSEYRVTERGRQRIRGAA